LKTATMEGLDKKAYQILTAADSKFHIDMIQPLRCGTARTFIAGEGAVLIRVSDTWLGMLEKPEKAGIIAQAIVDNGKAGDGIYCHGLTGRDEIAKSVGGIWYEKPCYIGALFSETPFEIDTDLEFRRLDHGFADFIHRHYTHAQNDMHALSYIHERLDDGMYGGFLDGKCIGFIGIHAEGAMGMLEILSPFRRRGYGRALEAYLSNILIAEGKIPYCHIICDNSASIELQKSMGFWVSDRKVWWGSLTAEVFD